MGNTQIGEAMPESEIRRWLRLYRGLNDLANNLCPMPEEAMDNLVTAADVIARAIVHTPATTKSDVADKFRLLAELVDDPAGTSSLEDNALADAVTSLVAINMRNNDITQCLHAEFLASRAAPAMEAAE